MQTSPFDLDVLRRRASAALEMCSLHNACSLAQKLVVLSDYAVNDVRFWARCLIAQGEHLRAHHILSRHIANDIHCRYMAAQCLVRSND